MDREIEIRAHRHALRPLHSVSDEPEQPDIHGGTVEHHVMFWWKVLRGVTTDSRSLPHTIAVVEPPL